MLRVVWCRKLAASFLVAVCLGLVAPAWTAAAADRVALVIGNGRYTATTPLNNPSNDASDVARALRGIGFEVVEGLDLSKRDMEGKIREFSRKLSGARIALFFYAGHALQVDGQNYLLPTDTKLEQAGDLPFDTIDLQVVFRQMETQTQINLVIIDACRDNPLARNFQRLTRSASVGRGLATVRSPIGSMIAFATEPGNVALDGDGRNSPFTTALLKHIATPGLDISVLMRRIRADVISATNRQQVPWDHSSLVDSVVLVPASTPAQAAPAPATQVPAPQNSAPAPQRPATTATPVDVLPELPKSVTPAPAAGAQTANAQTSTQQPTIYSPWTKFCGKDNNNPGTSEACFTMRQARLENGEFLAGAALIEQRGSEKKLFRITLPLGMQLPQGTRILLDREQPLTARYVVCLPSGCLADLDVTAGFVGKLKRGQQIVLQAINLPGQAVSYTLPLADFARAHEGPPTDLKKSEEDQKRLQAGRSGRKK